MRPYGERNKINSNIPDVHPQKGYTMWWKIDWDDVHKGAERQRAKRQIRKELNDKND